jgi:25S rRNA (adenine2142-N1)-methyltransferase
MPNISRNRKRTRPLAPAPLRSLKQARKVTSNFHRLSRQLAAAQTKNDTEEVARLEKCIEEAGGREEYQRASQVSTAVHSTSKWILSYLARHDGSWIYGRPTPTDESSIRRTTRLLEIGAINSELLEAAARSKGKLHTRAIDLHASLPEIEEKDFLKLALNGTDRYDVIVCSMVLNCVNTAEERGRMVCRLFHFAESEGLVFVTIPKSCLTLSPYMDERSFIKLLETVGFEVVESKTSPKLSFFILCRPTEAPLITHASITRWTSVKTINRGKKYRQNDFSIVLTEDDVHGVNL